MTPRQIAIRVAKAGRLSVLPDDISARALLYTAGLGLIRWDIDVPDFKSRAYVLTDKGREAVGDIQLEKRRRKK